MQRNEYESPNIEGGGEKGKEETENGRKNEEEKMRRRKGGSNIIKYEYFSSDFGPVPPDGVPRRLDGAAKFAHGRLEKTHCHKGTFAGAENETNQRWYAGPLLPGLRSPDGPGGELCGEHSGYLRPPTEHGG